MFVHEACMKIIEYKVLSVALGQRFLSYLIRMKEHQIWWIYHLFSRWTGYPMACRFLGL